MRYLFSAAASAFMLPLVNAITVAGANGVAAALGVLSFFLLSLIIKLGQNIRAKQAEREVAALSAKEKGELKDSPAESDSSATASVELEKVAPLERAKSIS